MDSKLSFDKCGILFLVHVIVNHSVIFLAYHASLPELRVSGDAHKLPSCKRLQKDGVTRHADHLHRKPYGFFTFWNAQFPPRYPKTKNFKILWVSNPKKWVSYGYPISFLPMAFDGSRHLGSQKCHQAILDDFGDASWLGERKETPPCGAGVQRIYSRCVLLRYTIRHSHTMS